MNNISFVYRNDPNLNTELCASVLRTDTRAVVQAGQFPTGGTEFISGSWGSPRGRGKALSRIGSRCISSGCWGMISHEGLACGC